jgi:exopolysaccharide production protein ExoZ
MPRSALLPAHTSLPLPSTLRQIDGLQLLRAVAVILIAWLHAGEKLRRYGGFRSPELGVFGVDIFFVISGFILSSVVMRERQGPGLATTGLFLQRRFVRIYPVYWIFAIISIAKLTLHHQFVAQNYIAAWFLLPSLHYPVAPWLHEFSWTLIFEMFFYLALSALLLKTVRFATQALIAVLLLLVTAGVFLDIHRPILIIICNPILLEFAFGAALALIYRRFGRRRYLGMAMTFAGVVLAIGLRAYNSHTVATGLHMIRVDAGVFERVATFGIAALLLVGGVILWSPTLTNRVGRLFVILGNASYSTYLLSSIGIELSVKLLVKVGGAPMNPGKQVLYDVLGVILVLAFGWLFYDLVEWPLLRAIQARLANRRSTMLSPSGIAGSSISSPSR